jgi:hypothetical protein
MIERLAGVENTGKRVDLNNSGFLGKSGIFDMITGGEDEDEFGVVRMVKTMIDSKLGEENRLIPADSRYQLTKSPGGIIVFVYGGLTLEESVALQKLNESNSKINIISGGTQILSISR